MKKKHHLPSIYTETGLIYLWDYLLAHHGVQERAAVNHDALGFLAHCLTRFPQSKAHLLQDLYVTYKLADRKNGFFVEFGAADGVFLSNTYHLEKNLGWRGILAEPFPGWRDPLRSNRSADVDYRCVWRESGKQLEFLAANRYPELSSLKSFAGNDMHAESRLVDAETFLVDTVSLNDLLSEHGAPGLIDYLSVDTEGSEFDILETFDFDKYQVRIITVEHNFKPDARESIRRLLESNGFRREFEIFSKADDWYFHPDRM